MALELSSYDADLLSDACLSLSIFINWLFLSLRMLLSLEDEREIFGAFGTFNEVASPLGMIVVELEVVVWFELDAVVQG